MASQYDSEISGLMDRIQQLRDLRNVSSNQPETNTEPSTNFLAKDTSFEVEQTTVDYSDDGSESRTDTPESEDFDQLSMRRQDSLFPVVVPAAAQKVSVFSIADFMAHVPSATVVPAVQPAEGPQEEIYDEFTPGDSKDLDSSNEEIQFHLTEDHDNGKEGELQQMLHQYNDLLAEVSSYEAADPANEIPYLQDAVQEINEVSSANTMSSALEPEPEPALSPPIDNAFQARLSPSIAHPEHAPSSPHGTEPTVEIEATGESEVAPGSSPEVDVVVTEQGETAEEEVEVLEEIPLPRVDVPVPIPLPAVMTTTSDSNTVEVHCAVSPSPSRQRRSVTATSASDRPVASNRRGSVEVRDKSPAKVTVSARRSSRSISPKSGGVSPRHSSPGSDRVAVHTPTTQKTQNTVAGHSGDSMQQEGSEDESVPQVRAQSPTEARDQSPLQQRRSSQQNSTPSPEQNNQQQQSRKHSPRPQHQQQQPAYQLRVSGELDALVQYKAALFLQSQLVDKLIQAKSALMEAGTDEQRMRMQIGVAITAEMLEKSVLQSEVLSCIVLGDLAPPPPPEPASPSRPTSQQKQSAQHQSHSAPNSAHSAYSAHSSSHRALSSWQLRSASPTDSVGSTSTASNVSVIGGQRVDLVRRSPTGAINSTPLTGTLKRIPSTAASSGVTGGVGSGVTGGVGSVGGSASTTLGTPSSGARRSATPGATAGGSAPRSASSARGGTNNPAGNRTLFPASPQVSVDALRRNATLVHSLVGNIDNYCSCCRTKLVDMTNHKTSSLKHSQCRYCIHSH